jgi:hypothetical protein
MIKEEGDKEEDIESKEVGDGVLMRTRSFVAKIPPPGLSSTQISYHEEMERGMAYVWGAIPVFFFFFREKKPPSQVMNLFTHQNRLDTININM